ncbi:S24 family peptidase [Bosea sp. PAMC 26642]|uniref:S24 family peptidase n=1 Tax=Bosea sp. (strain PAMC 26642) TaxID=1792307 RepID=UPI0007704772|nr:S24/S26 family peptidase [Bosea sp. PAMC 26642]AMJ61991.1 hypothetical protein AXW83_18295 [Bosea sp. PAMC 26642]
MDLFPTPLRPDAFQSARVRLHRVESDNMEPTLRSRWDYVLVAPVHTYAGEGLYLIQHAEGDCQVYRCQCNGQGDIWLLSDNKLYSRHTFSRAKFEARVLAKVLADVKVRDDHELRALAA